MFDAHTIYQFCFDGPHPANINTPYLASDGRLYATDGAIIIRVNKTDVEDGILFQTAKDVAVRLKEIFDRNLPFPCDWFHVSKTDPLPQKVVCLFCDGDGSVAGTDGSYMVKCPTCDGQRVMANPELLKGVVLHGYEIARHYVDKIASMGPGAEMQMPDGRIHDAPVWFRFVGGEGLVMQLRETT